MSLASVTTKIKAAMQDRIITQAEAQGIVDEAAKNGVTLREAKAVADLFMTPQTPSGPMMTMMVPEYPGDLDFQGGSKSVLKAFLDRNLIPTGADLDKMKTQIKSVAKFDAPMAKKPDVSRLFLVQVSAPLDMARDLPDEKAYVNLKTGQFYVRTEGGFVQNPSAKFFGPFQLPPVAEPRTSSPVSDGKMATMVQAFNDSKSTLSFTPGAVFQQHMGEEFVAVPLVKGIDDEYSYTAYLPTGALAPNATETPADLVNQMYIERTGGLAGLTETAGPIGLPTFTPSLAGNG
jgi:hypothetical protein